MRLLTLAAVILALFASAGAVRADTIAITGGKVFDGEKFVARDLFVQDGVFVAERPARLDHSIDATGMYLLPSFAEAHTHNFFGGAQSKGANQAYLRSGFFYALSANNTTEIATEWRNASDEDMGGSKVDVLFANGGLTAPGGHPVDLYRTIHTRFMGQPAETFLAAMDDNAFYQVSGAETVKAKFQKLMSTNPDLIKLYLLGHDSGGQKFTIQGNEVVYHGLGEADFRAAVKLVHDAGKRCIVHVETASDVALAVDAGADGLAHLPYAMQGDVRGSKLISPETTKLIAQRRMAVIATCGLGLRLIEGQQDPELAAAAREVWESNLRSLKEAGAVILLGSDQFTPIPEANALEKSGVYTRSELLKLWVCDTPRWMFPERKLGDLESGSEASVIGLAADPLEQWVAIQQIKLSIKQGRILVGNAPEPDAELLK